MTEDIKKQRDRYLAFSFAGGDVLIEINLQGVIQFAKGSTVHMTGLDEKNLVNVPLKDLLHPDSHSIVNLLLENSRFASKNGPYLVTLKKQSEEDMPKLVYLTGLRMSEKAPISCVLTYGDGLMHTTGFEDTAAKKAIATPAEFEVSLRKKIPELLAANKIKGVQLVELDNVAQCQKEIGASNMNNMLSNISQTLMDHSLLGDTAVKIDNGKYLLLKDKDSNDAELDSALNSISKNYDVDKLVNVTSKAMAYESKGLNQRELTRAILYTVQKMETGGIASSEGDLKDSFDSFMRDNIQKISHFKRMISNHEFNLNFQPIVDIKTEAISHHEVLVRFNTDMSPYELITMGEDVGIAPDVDLAICKQTMKYIDFNMSRSLGKFAVNISGASIQSENFIDRLMDVLKDYKKASKFLMFEITESSEIQDLDQVNSVIQILRNSGYAVCLDDFGAGAASFQYLHKLMIDGIKIDGSYIKTILSTPREATMVRNITKMCHELGVYVVAEMIETREQARFLADIGIDKGQGWLYGKATGTPLVKK